MALYTLCLLCYLHYLLMATSSAYSGITFARRNVHLTLPVDFPSNIPFWKVIAVLDDGNIQIGRAVNYRLRRVTWQTDKPKSTKHLASDVFCIDKLSGLVSVVSSFTEVLSKTGQSKIVFVIEVSGECEGRYNTTFLTVKITTDSVFPCRPQSSVCFPSENVNFYIRESLNPGIVFDSIQPLGYFNICNTMSLKYEVIKGNEIVSIHSASGQLILRSFQDAEERQEASFKILCTVSTNGKEEKYTLTGYIEVKDVDDNPPYLQSGTQSVLFINSTDIYPNRPLPLDFSVLDRDSKAVNNIDVQIENDYLDLFFVQRTSKFDDAFNGSMLFYAVIAATNHFHFPGCWYNFTVVFEDVALFNRSDNKVIFYVHIRNRTSAVIDNVHTETMYNITVNRHATLHSRVVQPIPVRERDEFRFQLETLNSTKEILGITPKTGIIYVEDEKMLLLTEQTQIQATIRWTSLALKKGECIILIDIIEDDNFYEKCDASNTIYRIVSPTATLSCSASRKRKDCIENCGRGSISGKCQWRTKSRRITVPTSNYSTCSPDLATCPDGTCDELEVMDKWICPQDCAKTVTGQGNLDFSSGKGIQKAVGPCSCPDPFTCTCGAIHHRSPNNNFATESHIIRGSTKTPYLVTWSHFPNENRIGMQKTPGILFFGGVTSTTACGRGCVAFIFLGVSCSLIGFVVFVFFCRVKKNQKHQVKQKYLGSRISLAVQPFDLGVEELSSAVLDSQANSDCSSNKGMYDAKWEFPRESLVLEEVLGEGEFGKVVRAQAWNVEGNQEYKTVAVKMLKGNGTAAEYQDLLSEFQLLRDIVHPNVIRLLGACTQKGGPLYVIVEYAELGSLRNYLRQCRRLGYDETSLANPCYDSGYGLAGLEIPVGDVPFVTQRDLLSFYWQIAKGMMYLSDMKLVHRDLAARNVLLATGKVIKISDFGLSRDVYEGDTYLKKSKGPVPVKWMAIESLEDHIYTTRSDVWAFGVVLWEVVTLGAAPYPGIVPERLFHLLKAGYRMPQPANCPNDLYRIMRSCWRESPHDRPSFKDLVQKFDSMLQDTTSYLDFIQESLEPFSYLSSCSSNMEDKSNEEIYGQIKLHDYSRQNKNGGKPRYTNYHGSFSSSDENENMKEAIV